MYFNCRFFIAGNLGDFEEFLVLCVYFATSLINNEIKVLGFHFKFKVFVSIHKIILQILFSHKLKIFTLFAIKLEHFIAITVVFIIHGCRTQIPWRAKKFLLHIHRPKLMCF
jgi:hypothetical protein